MTIALPACPPCIYGPGIRPAIGDTVYCALKHKGAAAVLEEWIRNVPLTLVERIVADRKAQGTPIWSLASIELMRRTQETSRAA